MQHRKSSLALCDDLGPGGGGEAGRLKREVIHVWVHAC